MIKKALLFIILFYANSAYASYLWSIDSGISEFYKGNFNYSRDYFKTYLKSNPNDENGYWWLARSYQKLRDTDNALKNFEKSYLQAYSKKEIEKINFNPKENANIEDYFDMAAEYFSNGNFKEADFYADMMLKIDAKSASAYFMKAKIAKTLKNDEEAVEYIKQAIIYNHDILKTNLAKSLNVNSIPDTTKSVYKYNAQEFYYKGELKEAILNAKKYIELDKNADMMNFLIDLHLKNNDTSSAKTLIDELKNDNLANIQTYIFESQIAKDTKESEKALSEAYQINPNNQDVLLHLGNLYLKKKDYKNSLKYFEALNAVNTDLYEGYFGLAFSRLKLNQNEEALDLIRKMNSENPDSSENLFLLSFIAQNQKSYSEALEYLDEAIKKDKNPNYYIEKAKILYILKDYQQSLDTLKQSAKTNGTIADNTELNEYYIKNYIKLNEIQEAQRLLTYDTKLDKNRIMYKYYLYNLCKLQGTNSANCQKAFKPSKPSSENDYIDLAEIFYEKNDLKGAAKVVDTGLIKYPYSSELMSLKTKLEYYYDKH